MPTLEELLTADLGESSQTKEASLNADIGTEDEIEKLAMEIGLVEDANPDANDNKNPGQLKEANVGLDQLYVQMYDEDVQPAAASVKTASITKEAAEVEEAMGKIAHDAFQAKVDQIITKIAKEKIASGDAEPAQTMDNNRVDADGKPIDTKPVVDNELPAENGGPVVGAEKQQAHGNGEMKHAAMRKALLLTKLDK